MSALPVLRDLVGVPFEIGTKVAWFISGRYGAGMVIGVVTRMEVKSRELSRYDYSSRTSIKELKDFLEVDLKPLVKGRKLRTMSLGMSEGEVTDEYGGRDVVVIANQNFGDD